MNTTNTTSSKADRLVSPKAAPWKPEATAEALLKMMRKSERHIRG